LIADRNSVKNKVPAFALPLSGLKQVPCLGRFSREHTFEYTHVEI